MTDTKRYPRMASLKTPDDVRRHAESLGVDMPIDDSIDVDAMASSIEFQSHTIGNRFCILPMEGWDGTTDGKPTDLTHRRWRNFGLSGAKWIWGGEAVAVRHDGRANPNQVMISDANAAEIGALRDTLFDAHREHFGDDGDLFVGLQLTHSGRWARPNQKTVPEPMIAVRNPPLDRRLGIEDETRTFTDDQLKRLIDDFIAAAVHAWKLGFAFVDIKHCHGYLGHELLTGRNRPGPFGGSLDNRLKFFRDIVDGIRDQAPGLLIGTRLSLFDFVPFEPDDDGVGRPVDGADPQLSFACGDDGVSPDLEQTDQLLSKLAAMDVRMICTTAGIPYATPHIQRPATFPPTDGYGPPEDPLVGVARQIAATAEMKRRHDDMLFIGSGYTYLQDHLARVGGAVVRDGMADSIGLGRMVLSYPDLPADVIAGREMTRKKICRTFSDCTSAPRNGMISGCYPLDPFYKDRPERQQLVELKR